MFRPFRDSYKVLGGFPHLSLNTECGETLHIVKTIIGQIDLNLDMLAQDSSSISRLSIIYVRSRTFGRISQHYRKPDA